MGHGSLKHKKREWDQSGREIRSHPTLGEDKAAKISRLKLAHARGCLVRRRKKKKNKKKKCFDNFPFRCAVRMTLELICFCLTKVTRRDRESRCSFTWLCAASRMRLLTGATGCKGNAEARQRSLGVSCNNTLTSTEPSALLSPDPRCHARLYPRLASTWLASIPLLTLWPLIPFLFQSRLLTALFNIHIFIFIIPPHSTLPSKKAAFLLLGELLSHLLWALANLLI